MLSDISHQRHPSAIWPVLMIPGQIVAYAAVPLSLAYGPLLPVPNILASLYTVAAIGVIAVLRRAVVAPLLVTTGYVCLGWYAVLLGIGLLHGGVLSPSLSYQANIFASNFVLLAFPFFVIGLRELRVEGRVLQWVIMPCILFVAGVSIWQFAVMGMPRPAGFSTNPIPFAFICMVWSLFLFARALSASSISWIPLSVALVGLVPIALSGSKIVWLSAIVACLGLFLVWIRDGRRWATLAVSAVAAAPVAWLLYQSEPIRVRLTELGVDLGAFLATGNTSGPSFGLRLSAAVGSLRAFVERPLFGYGMAAAKVAATEHQAPGMGPFDRLYHLHNEYLTWMLAFGVPGLLFVLTLAAAFFFFALRAGDTAVRRYGAALGAALAVFMTAEVISYHPQLQGLVFFVLGFLLMSATVHPRAAMNPPSPPAAGRT